MLRFLLNAGIAAKMMAILVLVVVLFLGALLLEYLPSFERELLKDRRESLKHMGEVAHALLSEYQQRVERGELSREEAQNRAADRIRNLRYGDSNYYWINDDTLLVPSMVMHPIFPELEGKACTDPRFNSAAKMRFGVEGRLKTIPDADMNIFQAFVEVVNECGEGYVTYSWPKPSAHGATEELFLKESYVTLFAPWGWVVGTGVYIDDIHARLVRLRWSIMAATAGILTTTMILLASFIAVFIVRPMRALMQYAERISAGELNAEVKGRFYAETARLKSVITEMVSDLNGAVKRAEAKHDEALQEAEKSRRLTEKLEALFTSMTEIVAVYELVLDGTGMPVNYRITDCNSAFTAAEGVAREDMVGKLATEVYQAHTAPYLDTYARVAMTGKACSFEMHDTRWNKHFIVSVASPAKNTFATIATDITAARQARQTIDAKNRELEQIIYVASHDLRSPLVNVDGYARELEYAVEEIKGLIEAGDGAPEKLEGVLRSALPDMTDALGHIRNSTRQMDALLRGLLKLSRSGRAALSIGPLDMNELVAQTISSLEFQIREAGAEIRLGPLPPCRGDTVQVTQVFTNLIGNALKYLVPERPGVIEITGAIERGRSTYFVKDNGVGIAPTHQEIIFELFHRLEPSKSEGEGLGLTIVRQILSRLDGEIRVESTPGEGSRFIVTLPPVQPAIEKKRHE
ncbi:MAG TPA: cache domain-containing protein [Candidatus Hydrogenedentes bacterium]|nr:cache domain-containing protein [Candidatus Hydrogenedentota bacterium]HPG68058.1 cache domain-containing protein [Candidatus Hydrogenedentota bacterium]